MKLDYGLVACFFRHASNKLDSLCLTHAVDAATCLNFVRGKNARFKEINPGRSSEGDAALPSNVRNHKNSGAPIGGVLKSTDRSLA